MAAPAPSTPAAPAAPLPGPAENLHREVRGVFNTHMLFEGAKVDIGKIFSSNFQVSHGFALNKEIPKLYTFSAVFADEKHLMQGNLDSTGLFSGRFHYNYSPNLVLKVQPQFGSGMMQSMVQYEADYSGPKYSANVKVLNPSLTDLSGIVVGSYLHAITSKLSLGIEGMLQKAPTGHEDSLLTLMGRYTGSDFVATANLSEMGGIQASYFQKINEKIELATEVEISAAGQKQSQATASAKFDFRTCTLRAQVDTGAKVALHLEEKLFPGMSFLISGEIDHYQGTNRFGLGLMMEVPGGPLPDAPASAPGV